MSTSRMESAVASIDVSGDSGPWMLPAFDVVTVEGHRTCSPCLGLLSWAGDVPSCCCELVAVVQLRRW